MQEGVEFLTGTRENWAGCLLEGHINWHLSLFYLGKKEGDTSHCSTWAGEGGTSHYSTWVRGRGTPLTVLPG